MKTKKLFVCLIVLLMLVIMVSGCVEMKAEGEIKSEGEASEAIADIGTDVESISTDIEGIEGSLG